MSRTLTEAVKTALKSSNVPMLVLVELSFASGFVRVCNAGYTFNWDPRGSLIPDTDTLIDHSLYTVGATAQITDLGSTISAGVGHVNFSRTGTTGSDRRIRTSTGEAIAVDKAQDSTYTVEFKPVQGSTFDFYTIGSAVDDQPNIQKRLMKVDISGTATGFNGCTVINQVLLADGYYRITVSIPAAFWTGSGSSCYQFVGGSWTTIETTEYHYRNPTFTQPGIPWLGLGNMGSIDAIQEGGELQMYGCTLTLSGIPSEYINLAFGHDYQGRPATIWLAPLTSDYQIISDPAIAFLGRMDVMNVEIGETATITVSIESKLVDWERPRVRRYNHEDQITRFPNDRGLEFVQQMVERELIWGRS